jgi:hypothetical protein
MGSGEGSSLFPKIATVLLGIAFLFHLIAIGSTWWGRADPSQTDRAEHLGLWKYCADPIGGSEACNDFVDIIYGDWLKAVQSFMILSLFTLPASIGIVAMYAFVSDFEGNMKILGAAMGVVAITGIFTLLTVAIFGGRFQEYFNNRDEAWSGQNIGVLDWSFALAVTDCVLTFISLGLLIASVATDDKEVYYGK